MQVPAYYHYAALAAPPSGNRYWRHVGGRVLRSREAREYITYVEHLASGGRMLNPLLPGDPDIGQFSKDEFGPIANAAKVAGIWIRARNSGDLDNRRKILYDALQGSVFMSDGQIVRDSWYMCTAPKLPGHGVVLLLAWPAEEEVDGWGIIGCMRTLMIRADMLVKDYSHKPGSTVRRKKR